MRSFLSNLGVNLIVIYFAIAAYGSGANNHAQGLDWFVNQCMPSTAFVLILYFIQYFRYKSYLNLIILIEILSTIVNFICAVLYAMAHKTAFIYVQYEAIMSAMFIAELAIIGFVVVRDGYSKRADILRILTDYRGARRHSDLSTNKVPLCTIR